MVKSIFVVIATVFLVGCKKPNQEKLDELVKTGSFDESLLIEAIEKKISTPDLLKNLRFSDTLSDFYKENEFKPVWARYLADNKMANKVFNQIENCKLEGFKPEYYKLEMLKSKLQKSISESENVYENLAELEILVSDNMLSFHRDRVFGRTNPDSVYKGTYHLPRRKFPDFELFEILNYDDFEQVIARNAIKDTAYIYLQDLIKGYVDRQKSGEKWSVIDTVGIKKLEPGDTTDVMPAIAQKLFEIGIISEEETKTANPEFYNKEFAALTRRFQQRYGLFDDAIYGRKTFGLLNKSIQDRIDDIAANMERIRWFELPEQKPYIDVNLAACELYMYYVDSMKSMRVCIGKARPYNYFDLVKKAIKNNSLKPADHETPQIASRIGYMVLNPTWTVPRSIITREMWWKIKNDKFYLQKNGYGVFYKKREIRSDTIDWSKFTPTSIPFDIIQKSGDDNSLGRIKFIFPNKYSIYLHDTPQKSKFKWSERAVSHGCVRVEDPVLLGEFLAQNIDTLEPDDFRIHMGLVPREEERLKKYDPNDTTARIQPIITTRIIRLNKTMPIYFTYRTIYFDQDWKVHYRNDIYDKNKYIINAMNF
ncbi:MAG: L,D-transpeptidase family protein [Flavobacteriales bacterium]|nr:L,D-transpeptidase family protein [Flavobacteriales bacterium]